MKAEKLLSYFGRVGNQRFIPEIDGFRFLAIIPVVLLHLSTGLFETSTVYSNAQVEAANEFRQFMLPGAVGVYVFFAISGFVLALPFARHYMFNERKVALKGYFVRRLTRLEPPYLITLTVMFLAHWFLLKTEQPGILFEHYIASFFYMHNIVYDHWSLINPVAWSLEIEIQFYLLVPLLTRLFAIRSSNLRRMIILLLIASSYWVQTLLPLGDWHLRPSFLTSYQYFLAGFLIADLYLNDKLQIKKYFWDILGIVAVFIVFWLEYKKGIYRYFQSPAIIIAFIAAFKGKLLNSFFTNKIVSTIGGMCYITYLIHYALIHFIFQLVGKVHTGQGFATDYIVNTAIYLPIVIAVSAMAFVLIEKPFMYRDWPQKVSLFIKEKIYKK